MMSYALWAGGMYIGHKVLTTASTVIHALATFRNMPNIETRIQNIEDEDDYEGLLEIGNMIVDEHKGTDQLSIARTNLCKRALNELETVLLTYNKEKQIYNSSWMPFSRFDEHRWLHMKNHAAHVCRLRLQWFDYK